MKKIGWGFMLGVSLIALSAAFYFVHYLIFRDTHHIFIYLVGDVAFVFIEVLMVTLIIHRLLEAREKKSRLEKLNMVIGSFFSEVGMKLLRILSVSDSKSERMQQELSAPGEPLEQRYRKLHSFLKHHGYGIERDKQDLDTLKALLVAKKDFMLRLLENPHLLEHEAFTEVLRAVFHLAEELDVRESLQGLPNADYKPLYGDAKRIYKRLALQWLDYMEHLKKSYPYLFSLSIRTNPFDRTATAIVQG